jgi:secreted trypsin-like serine protease
VSYVQVGVVSYGLSPDCGGANVGFYTSTSHWRAWIATTLAANGQAA